MRNRKDTLHAVICEMRRLQQRGIWSRKLVEHMLSFYQEIDSDGKEKEYAGIVTWYLQKKLGQLE